MAGLFYGVDHGIWVTLLLAVPAAALVVRLFRRRRHALHHATSGNLDRGVPATSIH